MSLLTALCPSLPPCFPLSLPTYHGLHTMHGHTHAGFERRRRRTTTITITIGRKTVISAFLRESLLYSRLLFHEKGQAGGGCRPRWCEGRVHSGGGALHCRFDDGCMLSQTKEQTHLKIASNTHITRKSLARTAAKNHAKRQQ